MTNIEHEQYSNPWIYRGIVFTSSDICNFYGFVYCITNIKNNRKYLGRKYFWSFRKPKGKTRRVRSESNWKQYYGSSDELNEERKVLGNELFKREIISLHESKGKVNFEETKKLFVNNVLTESLEDGTPKFYNSNILGRYYRKDYLETK